MTAPVVLVRSAGRDDADRITSVFLASRAAALPYLPDLHTLAETLEFFQNVVLPQQQVWVARSEDGDVVGFAALHHDWLDHLYVRPDLRGAGVGSVLLEAARDAAGEHLQLYCFQRNQQARAFYESRGFAIVASSDGSGNEEREPDLTYRWERAPGPYLAASSSASCTNVLTAAPVPPLGV